jgi:hypothetical protein
VGISVYRFCGKWVHVTTYQSDQMVFTWNCSEIVPRYDLEYNDTLEFKIQAFYLNMKIYMANTSTTRLYTCPDYG